MFGRNKNKLVSTEQVDAYQTVIDPKTEYVTLSETFRNEQLIDGVHPWHASNERQLQMVCFSIAYSNDRFAEILLNSTKVERGDQYYLSPDVELFARELSSQALKRLDMGKRLGANTLEGVEFNEGVRTNISPENMLPYWPEYPNVTDVDRPEWQKSEAGRVSSGFVEATLEATKELTADTFATAEAYAKSDIPPEYASVLPIVRDTFLANASYLCETAEGYYVGKPNDHALALAYQSAHDAYISAMQAHIILQSPSVLGEDFFPDRPQ